MTVASHPVPPPLLHKRIADDAPVTARSAVLFRFGEQCNNHCPMCSNTGEAGLFFHPTAVLLERAEFLRRCGFRRAVVTGGEATIHPGFWTVIERLAADGLAWDINTHGRSFAQPGFARRAAALGLQRAIVSLHSHQPAISAAIFGTREAAHHETVAGIAALRDAGVRMMVNCVLTRLNLDHLEAYLEDGVTRFGRGVVFKFVFPSTVGVGGDWDGIAGLRYADVREPVRRLRACGARLGATLRFESFPNCVLGDAAAINLGRSAFGETHYLDDARGDRVYTMRHIESVLAAYAPGCRGCAALRRCPGVARRYAERVGTDELVPFPAAAATER